MKLLDRISLTKKLRIYLMIVLVTFLLFAAILFTYLVQTLYRDATAQMETDFGRISEQLLSTLRLQRTLVVQLVSDESLKIFVDTDYSSINPAYQNEVEKLDLRIRQYKQYFPGSFIRIYSDNSTIRSFQDFSHSLNEALALDWVDERVRLGDQSQGVFWGQGTVDGFPYLVCYRGSFSNVKPYGLKMIVALGIRVSDLEATLAGFGESADVAVMSDADGVKLVSPHSDITAETLRELMALEEARGFESINGTLSLTHSRPLASSELDIAGWQLAAALPLDSLLDGFIQSAIIWFVLATILFILLMLLTRMVSRNIVQRTETVLAHIGRIASEDFSLSSELEGSDEFYLINEELNGLTIRLKRMIEDEYKSKLELSGVLIDNQRIQLARQEAEIVSLQNQINPHYIFNTLEAIRMNLLLHGDEKSSEMVQYLAESLRTYAHASHGMLSIREELAFLERFIKLQNFRYNGSIGYHVDIDEELAEQVIPHFILQPLVENAIQHGFKNMVKGAHIGVSFVAEDDSLYINVSDNGFGIEEARLLEIMARLKAAPESRSANGGSIGLINVNRRVKLLYGDDCGVSIRSKPGYGTEVEIRLRLAGGE